MKSSNRSFGLLLSGSLLLASGAFAQAAQSPNPPAAGSSPSGRAITPLNPGPPPPAHPLTQDQTTELLDLMGFKKMEESNWSEMMAMSKARIPFMPPDVWTDVQNNLDAIHYSTTLQPVFAKYLSQEDAAKAIAFFSTPAGKRVAAAMPMIMAESLTASQQKGREAANSAISAHRTEIEAARQKYVDEHTPKTAPGGMGAPAPGAAPGGPASAAPPASNPSGPAATPQPSAPQH